MNQEEKEQEKYNELAYYTLSHPNRSFFIHQYVVDAFAAQNGDENTKPIKITFALVGLYLCAEKNYTGRQVQLAHMQLAKYRKKWPTFDLPKDRGEITISDVLKIPAGERRDEKILEWCKSVWKAYEKSHNEITELVRSELKQDE